MRRTRAHREPLAPAPGPMVGCLDPHRRRAIDRPSVVPSAGIAAETGFGGGCGPVAARLQVISHLFQGFPANLKPCNRKSTPARPRGAGVRAYARACNFGFTVSEEIYVSDKKGKTAETSLKPGRNRVVARFQNARNPLKPFKKAGKSA
ncbi:hypothetical protein P2H44_22750 [Albimonas sp. CAU 1670]|uniref:hypothetical protein n=1 Tax=Albimonas sp. CAU 1670 TaxID=3032599 RepID=UPI0023DCA738|nr:hypothetical protein [Albimonas sp. CAU 1670]MDF2235385.1 hypothetical protein [Albimonas sp. CAU 1670]